jgi:S-DNA-T family DNA segregation ATPase FtsK/SpoIIIE
LPTRIQGTYVTNGEIKNLIDFLKASGEDAIEYKAEVTEKYLGEEDGGASSTERDPLFEEAAGVVISAGKASTSYLQRRMSLGYNRAAKIMDQLEKAGVIGPAEGVKPRSILVANLEELKAREAE